MPNANYEIRIKEGIPKQWLNDFETIDVETSETQSIIQIYLTDQAALHGFIAQVRDLGLTLTSVKDLQEES